MAALATSARLSSALERGFMASLVGESLANYKLADEPLTVAVTPQHIELSGLYYDDQHFWESLGSSSKACRVDIVEAALSEWVARIPGLYWQRSSVRRREIEQSDVENPIGDFVTLRPLAKSRVVSGGVGTIRLPPSESGCRLVTLTTSLNASAGVPALISPEIWDELKLEEGTVIQGRAAWQPMPLTWSRQFPQLAGLARNCLVFRKSDDVSVQKGLKAPVEVHPFAIMEYTSQKLGTQLHDFVYATSQTRQKDFHKNLGTFFEKYRTAQSRDGIYLTGADLVDPMWPATFASPEDMRRGEAAALNVIESRIDDEMQGQDTIEALLELLSSKDRNDLIRLSTGVELPPNRWSEGGSVGDEAIRLVDGAQRAGKIAALLYAVQGEENR